MTRSFNLWERNVLRHFLNFRKKRQEVQFISELLRIMRMIASGQLTRNCLSEISSFWNFFVLRNVVVIAFTPGVCSDIILLYIAIVQL